MAVWNTVGGGRELLQVGVLLIEQVFDELFILSPCVALLDNEHKIYPNVCFIPSAVSSALKLHCCPLCVWGAQPRPPANRQRHREAKVTVVSLYSTRAHIHFLGFIITAVVSIINCESFWICCIYNSFNASPLKVWKMTIWTFHLLTSR